MPMSKPFQFSLRRLLGTVALLSVAARLAVWFFAVRFEPYSAFVLLGFCAVGGGAIGCIEGKTIAGALYGLGVGLLLVFIIPATTPARE
jgi:membrane associated rhomboid family serine protease